MATTSPHGSEPPRKGLSYWWSILLGIVFAALGLVLAAGGVWLVALGGSWYYVCAGAGLLISGILLFGVNIGGFWVYLLTWIGTLIWAFWEVGADLWPLVPRVVAPTVLLIALIFALPALRRRRQAGVLAGFAAVMAAAFVLTPAPRAMAQVATIAEEPQDTAQEPTAPDAAPAEAAPETTAADTPAADTTTPETDTEADAETTDTSEPPADTEAPDTASDAATDTPPVSLEERQTARPQASREAQRPLESGPDWPAYGATESATRYSPLSQITAENVGELEEAWRINTGDMPAGDTEGKYSPENTPIKVGNSLFMCTAMNIMLSLDPATGREKWRYDPQVSPDAIPYGATCRGVTYYADPNAEPDALCAARVVQGTLDARLIAVDAETGQLCPEFGQEGMVDLNEGIGETVPGWYAVSSPPVLVRGVLVTGAQVKDGQAENAPSGVVRGYDAVTGELVWAWDMGAPDRTGAPAEGEVYTRGTPNMWTIAATDEELGFVYLPMGNSSVDYYGGNREEFENEYSTSLVAIDATTGEVAWHFQTVHYDVWDYDLGSQPTLIDMPDGTRAVILPSKQGQIYVLNAETGESLFPVEEREVPTTGGVEDGNYSPTQPYSGYASLAKPRLEEKDMWGMSPIDQLWCRIQFRRANYKGEYTPPSADRPWIQYPGYNGGSDWGSIAVDPERGILIANYNDMPNFNQLIPRDKADEMGLRPINEGGNPPAAEGAGDPQAGSPYAINVNAGWRLGFTGMLCKEPPYGWIRGIDLATGETLWDHPLGSAVNNGPFGIPSMLPMTIGTPNNGGPIITAGGVAFVAATTDNRFRAFDVETGEELWQTELPGGGQTTPITYEADGRQFVVIAPGGHHFMETPVSDAVIAYALPQQ